MPVKGVLLERSRKSKTVESARRKVASAVCPLAQPEERHTQPNLNPECFFATLTAVCLLGISRAAGVALWSLPILAAVFIQCRLLCNLFDGMVAVEGGKSTPSGELFNDIPDRVADPLIGEPTRIEGKSSQFVKQLTATYEELFGHCLTRQDDDHAA